MNRVCIIGSGSIALAGAEMIRQQGIAVSIISPKEAEKASYRGKMETIKIEAPEYFTPYMEAKTGQESRRERRAKERKKSS